MRIRHLAFVPALPLLGFLACSSSNSNNADAGPPPILHPNSPSDDTAQQARSACTFGPGAMTIDTQGYTQPDGDEIPIDTIAIVMMENRSFDHYFTDLVNNGWSASDVDVAPMNTTNPGVDGNPVPLTHGTQLCFADTNHGWDGTHQEINNGKMDGFAVANDGTHEDPMLGPPDFLSGARALVYYTKADLPFMYWAAGNFAIGDRYFASVPGPTYPNREYLYAGTSFGETTTSLDYLPTQVDKIVVDELTDKGVSWGTYAASLPTLALFGADARSSTWTANEHSFDQLATDAAAGTLPHVVFIDPNLLSEGYQGQDEHPPAVMQVGENWLAGVTKTLMSSKQWAHMAFFILYDEHGGLYDHVAPPPACTPDDIQPILSTPPDAGGSPYGGFNELGIRLPFVALSPYAKKHYVSHQVFDHTSVLRFIEARFGLPAMTKRDANALAPFDVFDFRSAPNLTAAPIPDVPVDQSIIGQCQQIFTAPDVTASPYGG